MRLEELFPDGGLRLGVLDALACAGSGLDCSRAFDEAARRIKADDTLHEGEGDDRSLDLVSYQEEVLRHAVAALGQVEFEASALEAVTWLGFDGGNEIYCMVIPEELASRLGCDDYDLDSGGETDAFEVRSLEGLQRLSALEVLHLDGHGFNDEGLDLTPLRAHPTLREITLTGTVLHPEVLLSVPGLEQVSRVGKRITEEVAAELRGRGVSLSD